MPIRKTLSCAVLCAVLSACADDIDPPRHATPARSAPQPSAAKPATVALANADLQPIDAPSLLQRVKAHGRGTVINVWASWCGSCREEVPMLLKLREAFLPEGIEFLFVTADEAAAWSSAAKLMRDWTGPLRSLAVSGSLASFKSGLNPRWRGALPATFLFDASGKLRHFWEGPIYEHEIAPILQGFLAGAEIDGETRPPLTGGGAPP